MSADKNSSFTPSQQMSSRALESRASASSSDRSAESHPSAPRSATASSTASEQRPRRQKGSSSHLSGHSSDHSAASDSSPSHTSSSTQISTPSDPSRHRHSHQTHQNKANSSSSKQTSARHLQEAHFLPNSTASSGFSSAMSDTSAHSTSGTSSPYASGVGGGGGSTSVFSTQRLSPADIKYRDERPKVVRSFIIGKLIGEGAFKGPVAARTKGSDGAFGAFALFGSPWCPHFTIWLSNFHYLTHIFLFGIPPFPFPNGFDPLFESYFAI